MSKRAVWFAARAGRLAALVVLLGVLAQPAPATAADFGVRISGMPAVHQWYNLSCEYAAAAAVTLYWGSLVSQNDFIREVPSSPNPHHGFRGDIDGPFGGLSDYGVYAEPLVPVLADHGYQATVFYGDSARLKAYLRAGTPVVVWITSGQAERQVQWATYRGETFRLVPGEHAVVAYGYDTEGVYVMDVGDGNYYHPGWASFLRRWGYFDEMALAIHPL